MKFGQIQFGSRALAVAVSTVLTLGFFHIQSRLDIHVDPDLSYRAVQPVPLPATSNPAEPASSYGNAVVHLHQPGRNAAPVETGIAAADFIASNRHNSQVLHRASISRAVVPGKQSLEKPPDLAASSDEHSTDSGPRAPRLEVFVTAGELDVAAFRAKRIKVFVAAGEVDVVAFEDPWLIARRSDTGRAEIPQFDIARLLSGGNTTETDIAIAAVQGIDISLPPADAVLANSEPDGVLNVGRVGMAGIEDSEPAQHAGKQHADGREDTFLDPLLDVAYVSEDQLEDNRGGFVLDNGIRIDFSIDRAAYVNDIEQFSAHLELPENLGNQTLSGVTAVQVGNSNQVHLADSTATIDLIQNSIDNQVIRDVTKLDIRIENFNINQTVDYAVPGFGKVDVPAIFR